MRLPDEIVSIPDVSEVEVVAGPGADATAAPDLLFELPHGATREAHFVAIRRRLSGDYPADLKEFFFVNTDVGAPECARAAAGMIVEAQDRPGRSLLIVRSLVPRTFVDCNRMLDTGSDHLETTGLTPSFPEYVKRDEDIRTLTTLYRAYRSVAEHAYALVCGAGGTAITLHTYAPKAVRIDRIDGKIVRALRRAYEPATYAGWPNRPDVDIISEDTDGLRLAPETLVRAVKARYAEIGVVATENETYRLHPSTMGHRHSTTHPGQVLCMEISRARLADPFTPFEEMRIGEKKVERMSAPLAAACLSVIIDR